MGKRKMKKTQIKFEKPNNQGIQVAFDARTVQNTPESTRNEKESQRVFIPAIPVMWKVIEA